MVELAPTEPEGDGTLRQLHESLTNISYITDSDDTILSFFFGGGDPIGSGYRRVVE